MAPEYKREDKNPSICIIGAGFGGLTIAIQLKRKLGLETFTIFEKSGDIGGAWLVNTYPGAACDIPSHLYSWSFEPNNEWSSYYAPQAEILDYMRKTAKKYELYSHLKVHTAVTSSIWIEEIGKWEVKSVDNMTGIEALNFFDFVIVGVSQLWNPSIPKIFEEFKGTKMHTAEWDHSVEIRNKVVGIVGCGQSAVQLIPNIVNQVKELHSFQRTPTTVIPQFYDVKFKKSQRWVQRNVPLLGKLARWTALCGTELSAQILRDGSFMNRFMTWAAKKYLLSKTSNNPDLAQLIQPPKSILYFCRNFATSSKYLSSLCSANVTVYRDDVKSLHGNSVVLGHGTEVSLDVLILATGFKADNFFGPLQIIGGEGVDILNSWTENGPTNYYGVCTKSAKNLFFIYGAQSAALTSAIFVMERQVNQIIKLLRHMRNAGLHQCQIKAEVEDKFTAEKEITYSKTIWRRNPECKLANEDGKGLDRVVYPGTGSDMWRKLRKFNPSNFNFF